MTAGLALVVTHVDGTTTRWGDDEDAVGKVPADLQFSTASATGFKDLSTTLLRELRDDGDEVLFDTVRVLADGGRTTVWEGRLHQMPRSTDAGGRVTPAAIGWSAHLEDDKTFRYIYLDRDTARWTSPVIERKIGISGSYKYLSGSTSWANGKGPTLEVNAPAYAWSSNAGRPVIALAYDAGPGLKVATVGGRFSRLGLGPSTGFTFVLNAADSADLAVGSQGLPSFTTTAGEGSVVAFTPSLTHRYWEWATSYPTAPAGSADANPYGFRIYGLYVVGDHALPIVTGAGTLPDGTSIGGVLASDVLTHALPRCAPLLNFTSGPTGTIRPTDFPIPDCKFLEPTTAADVIQRLNAYHRWDAAVWENRTLYFAPPGTFGRTWVLSTDDGLDLNLEGDSSDQVFTGVIVTYSDAGGVQHTVGPPGSISEFIDARLAITDPANPAIAHGITRRWAALSLSTQATTDAAAVIGAAWLNEQARATRRGSATKSGTVTDDQGNEFPACMVRGGDALRVSDRPGDPDRRIIETSYTDASETVSMTLDNTAGAVDSILERIGAVVGVALG